MEQWQDLSAKKRAAVETFASSSAFGDPEPERAATYSYTDGIARTLEVRVLPPVTLGKGDLATCDSDSECNINELSNSSQVSSPSYT